MHWQHKIDLRFPLSKEGLLKESFSILQGSREICFDVVTCTTLMVTPSKPMIILHKKVLRLWSQYRSALLIDNREATLESRFIVLDLFRKITEVLDGKPVPTFTPYNGNMK